MNGKPVVVLSILLLLISCSSAFSQTDDMSIEYIIDTVYNSIGEGNIDGAIKYSDIGIDRLSTTNDNRIFELYYLKAHAYYQADNLEKAQEVYREAIQNSGYYSPSLYLADNFRGLAHIHLLEKRTDLALENYEKAIEVYRDSSDYFSIAEIRNNIGTAIFQNEKHYHTSIGEFEAALDVLNACQNCNPDYRNSLEATLKHNIAVSYSLLGKRENVGSHFEQAEKYFRDALEMRKKINSQNIGSTLIGLADNYLMNDQNTDSAAKFLNQAEGMISDSLKKSTFYLVKGRYFEKGNDKEAALNYYQRSAQLAEEYSGLNEAIDAYDAIIDLGLLSEKELEPYYIKKAKFLPEPTTDTFSKSLGEWFSNPNMPELSVMQWLITSFISLFIAVFLMLIFVRKAALITEYNLGNRFFYLLLIPAAMSSAIFLFGAMKSYATYTGSPLPFGGQLELAGPVVIFAGVMYYGLKYGKGEDTFNFTVHLYAETGLQDLQGELNMDVGHERKTALLSQRGTVDFKNIPSRYRSKSVNLELVADQWSFANGSRHKTCKLKRDHARFKLIEIKDE